MSEQVSSKLKDRASGPEQTPHVPTAAIADLLARHYGDGIVYLPSGEGLALYHTAKQEGFINEEGYLSRKGRQLLAQHKSG